MLSRGVSAKLEALLRDLFVQVVQLTQDDLRARLAAATAPPKTHNGRDTGWRRCRYSRSNRGHLWNTKTQAILTIPKPRGRPKLALCPCHGGPPAPGWQESWADQ